MATTVTYIGNVPYLRAWNPAGEVFNGSGYVDVEDIADGNYDTEGVFAGVVTTDTTGKTITTFDIADAITFDGVIQTGAYYDPPSKTGSVANPANFYKDVPCANGAVVDVVEQSTDIEELQGQIALLQGATVTGGGDSNPVQEDLSLILSAGVEQSTANSFALVWTIADYAGPSVGSLSVSLELIHIDNYNAGVMTADLTKSGSVTKPGDDAIFTVQLDADDTVGIETSPPDVWWNYKYKLKISYNSNVIRQVLNSCVVRA